MSLILFGGYDLKYFILGVVMMVVSLFKFEGIFYSFGCELDGIFRSFNMLTMVFVRGVK